GNARSDRRRGRRAAAGGPPVSAAARIRRGPPAGASPLPGRPLGGRRGLRSGPLRGGGGRPLRRGPRSEPHCPVQKRMELELRDRPAPLLDLVTDRAGGPAVET